MKCANCGNEMSDRVYFVHIKVCEQRMKERGGKAEKIKEITKETTENIESVNTDNVEITKGLILQELKRKEIPHNPRDKKEVLLNILNESKEAE